MTAQWNLDPDTIHLNHGSFGAVPVPVLRAQDSWREAMERNPTRFFWRDLPRALPSVRDTVARFVGCSPERLILLPNITTAAASVLRSTPLAAGDNVLLTDDAYPGIRAAVTDACTRSGATVTRVHLAPDDLSPATYHDAVLAAVTPATRLAVVEHITFGSAILVDVAPLCAELRRRGVTTVVDGAHAPGAIDLDVSAIGAEYYLGSLHKWCCAPRGASFLAYGDAAPRAAVVASRAGEGLPFELEWWGTADYSALLAVPAALSFLEGFGWDELRARNRDLAQEGAAALARLLAVDAPTPSGLPMAVVPLPERFQSRGVEELRQALLDRSIEVGVNDVRGRISVRISTHAYNTLDDVLQLAERLPAM